MLKALAGNEKIYRDHADWFEYYRHNPYKFEDYYRFTVVRNPFDRVVSTYFYLLNGGNKVDDMALKICLFKSR